MLELLAANAGRVLAKQEIFERVWGWQDTGDPNVIEQHISNLRERVDRGHERKLIHTIRGVGYVLRAGDGPA